MEWNATTREVGVSVRGISRVNVQVSSLTQPVVALYGTLVPYYYHDNTLIKVVFRIEISYNLDQAIPLNQNFNQSIELNGPFWTNKKHFNLNFFFC